MSIKLSELSKATKTVKINIVQGDPASNVDDISLEVKYKLSYMTPQMEAKIRTIGEVNDSGVTVSQDSILAEIIDSWDLVDDSGKMIPITPKNIASLGLIVSNAIFSEIWDNSFPNSKKG